MDGTDEVAVVPPESDELELTSQTSSESVSEDVDASIPTATRSSFEDINIYSPRLEDENNDPPHLSLSTDASGFVSSTKPWYHMPLRVWPYISTFFITVAAVLGTGILGVPVKLERSGFTPFLATYSVTFVMQCLIILFVVEIMQRVHWMSGEGMLSNGGGHPPSSSRPHGDKHDAADEIEMREMRDSSPPSSQHLDVVDGNTTIDGQGLQETPREFDTPQRALTSSSYDDDAGAIVVVRDGVGVGSSSSQLEEGPDLHSMGKFFLGPINSFIYNAAVLLHFFTILISYGLAGPQAYHQLLEVISPSAGRWIKYEFLILPFIGIITLLIVFAMNAVRILISLLTTIKGSLLIVVVVVTMFVGIQVNLDVDTDWLYTLEPFLIGTLALGGAISVLPVAFSKIDYSPWGMRLFSLASIAGLFVVFVLNLLWAYSILLVVPQRGDEPSLEYAADHGQIATLPLVDVIKTDHKEYFWIAIVIEIFIISSITVSFMTMGGAFRHMMDGFIRHWHASQQERSSSSKGDKEDETGEGGGRKYLLAALSRIDRVLGTIGRKQLVLYIGGFGAIYVVAQLNPSAFLVIIEYASSLAINITSGLFTVLMLGKARDMSPLQGIPWPLPWWVYHTRWVVFAYFGFAVLYDIVVVTINSVTWIVDQVEDW